MKQSRQDEVILGLWAHSTIKSVKEGYDELARHYNKPRAEVKRMVHEALARQGANPHHSPSLIHAFTILNQLSRKGKTHE